MTIISGTTLNGQSVDVGYVPKIQSELDTYYSDLKELHKKTSVDVLRILSAISARLTEIRSVLVRSSNPAFNALRTKEIDPLIAEVERQFKYASRVASIHSLEWEMSKGGM